MSDLNYEKLLKNHQEQLGLALKFLEEQTGINASITHDLKTIATTVDSFTEKVKEFISDQIKLNIEAGLLFESLTERVEAVEQMAEHTFKDADDLYKRVEKLEKKMVYWDAVEKEWEESEPGEVK